VRWVARPYETLMKRCTWYTRIHIGATLAIAALTELGVYVYPVLSPIWALWQGVYLLRKPVR
jgi:hypothetical protein